MKEALRKEAERRKLKLGSPGRLDVETAPEWFHEGQRIAFDAVEQTVIDLCGNQSGKTASEPYWLLRETVRCAAFIKAHRSHRNAIFAGPATTLAMTQAIPLFRELWEEELKLGKFYESPKPKFVVSKEGGQKLVGEPVEITIHFVHASDPNNIESMTAFACVWDEAGQKDNKEASYNAIRRRLRIAKAHGFGREYICTTPYEWTWLKTRLVDRAGVLAPVRPDSDVWTASDGRVKVINWPSWMHPDTSEEECRQELENGMSEWEWDMFYRGWYTQPAGVIYGCWTAENEIQDFPIPDWWKRAVGMDFGPNNTAAVFFAEEQHDYSRPSKATGRWILYRTYLEGGKTNLEHVKSVLEIAGGTRRPIVYGGSHGEAQIRDGFTLAGLPVIEPKINDVEAQIRKVYAAIKTGQLVAFKTMTKWLSERANYSRVLDADGTITMKIKDDAKYHRLASTRYIGTAIFREVVNTVPSKSRFDREAQANRVR